MIFQKQVMNVYKGMAYKRCDDDGTAFYFSADDFPNLKREPYSFTASAGHKLQGYFYYYGGYNSGRLIVFDHGMGGGHRSYMKEIEMLCRRGYRVFAYDHTGCMESGGFSTLNITALHPEISHIVVLSGFVSAELLIDSYFGGILKGYRKAVKETERTSNPKFYGFNAVDTLLKSDVKALLIYSENDKMCGKIHYDTLKSGLGHKSNIKFLLVKNKGHNPNYTEDAVQYLGEYVKAKTALIKRKNVTDKEKSEFVALYDWDRMTAQDEKVWAEIFNCLDS